MSNQGSLCWFHLSIKKRLLLFITTKEDSGKKYPFIIKKMIFFAGKGGLSGDIWLATMLAALDDGGPLKDLERNIPWIKASLIQDDIGKVKEKKEKTQKEKNGKQKAKKVIEARIEIKGADDSPPMNWTQMRDFLLATDFPNQVKKKALAVLYNRQYHEAHGLGFPLEIMKYSGKGVGDTLFDVLGGVYFWHLLGSPPIGLSGYLDVGYFPPPATRKLLKNIPNKTPRTERELTTPTAAALLEGTYRDLKEPERIPDLLVITGGKYAYQGRISKTLSYHYF